LIPFPVLSPATFAISLFDAIPGQKIAISQASE